MAGRDAAADAGEGLRRRAQRRVAHRAGRRKIDVTRSRFRPPRCVIAAFVMGAMAGAALAVNAGPPTTGDLAATKAAFRRPAAVPFPPSNPFTPGRRALGGRLSHATNLSPTRKFAGASSPVRRRGSAEGRSHGRGGAGVPLKRHTPSLWNLAWAGPVFWDGRARSLEEQ